MHLPDNLLIEIAFYLGSLSLRNLSLASKSTFELLSSDMFYLRKLRNRNEFKDTKYILKQYYYDREENIIDLLIGELEDCFSEKDFTYWIDLCEVDPKRLKKHIDLEILSWNMPASEYIKCADRLIDMGINTITGWNKNFSLCHTHDCAEYDAIN